MTSFDFSFLVDSAIDLQSRWEAQGIRFCFIGGLAVLHWGEVRMTQDIDATVLTGFGNEQPLIEQLLMTLTPRISDAINFAKLHRVLLGQDARGVPIDVSLSGMPFETEVIERSQQREYLIGKFIRICGASDLVILKAFANRVRDWQDIRGILIRSASELNWDLIETELKTLTELKEEPEILTKLRDLRKSLNSN